MIRTLYSVECDDCCGVSQLAWVSEGEARGDAKASGWLIADSDPESDRCPGCAAAWESNR